jgi:hypothetical protein
VWQLGISGGAVVSEPAKTSGCRRLVQDCRQFYGEVTEKDNAGLHGGSPGCVKSPTFQRVFAVFSSSFKIINISDITFTPNDCFAGGFQKSLIA